MLHDFPRNMLIVVLVNAFNDIISVFAVLHFDNDLIPGLKAADLFSDSDHMPGKITEFAAVSIVPRKDNVAACYGIPAVFEPSGTERRTYGCHFSAPIVSDGINGAGYIILRKINAFGRIIVNERFFRNIFGQGRFVRRKRRTRNETALRPDVRIVRVIGITRVARAACRERRNRFEYFSEDVAAKIDSEIRRIMDEQNDRALKILDEHRDGVERVAAVLREKEQITGEEFAALFENKPLPEKKPAQIESESAAESPASVQEVQE